MGFRDVLNGINGEFKRRAEEERAEKQRQAAEARAEQERRNAEYRAANPPKSIWYHLLGYFSFHLAVICFGVYCCGAVDRANSKYEISKNDFDVAKRNFERDNVGKKSDEYMASYSKAIEDNKSKLEFNKIIKKGAGGLALAFFAFCVIYNFKETR